MTELVDSVKAHPHRYMLVCAFTFQTVAEEVEVLESRELSELRRNRTFTHEEGKVQGANTQENVVLKCNGLVADGGPTKAYGQRLFLEHMPSFECEGDANLSRKRQDVFALTVAAMDNRQLCENQFNTSPVSSFSSSKSTSNLLSSPSSQGMTPASKSSRIGSTNTCCHGVFKLPYLGGREWDTYKKLNLTSCANTTCQLAAGAGSNPSS